MINFSEIKHITDEHWKLLLLADPSRDMVESYIKEGKVYIIMENRKILGIIVLVENSPNEIEIKNIAVDPKYQGKGYGRKFLQFAISKSKMLGYERLVICTGNSSIHQLSLYQNCGFQIVDTIFDFFVQNYEEEIWENGIQCRDLIKLEQYLY
ncbi:GNAT family N-acetyltransferase [Gottfriedia solisilvae]|uniref:Putative N-acetyltransferase YvbK n=1 Tax=Gottfriedia solisilvae TaxID=1516104 RepID=A0A8J3AEA1_9BACI|nr:GNAT family N-acetyltransferase [Gottfriedia solisilvae]GGI10337.1 putative N-acetyltransferase YvbK [Gottfriedia solisilvae]